MTEVRLQNPVAGFHDPIAQSQVTFRTIMTALSRPGRVCDLADLPTAPDGLPPVLAAITLTLADYETPVWLDSAYRKCDDVRAYISFETGAPLAQAPDAAAFALVSDGLLLPSLDTFSMGTQEYPDRSTTLLVAVRSFDGGQRYRLAGPGIEGTAEMLVEQLPDDFCAQWQANSVLFPRGVDLVLCTGRAIVGLPRTVKIMED